MTNIGFVFPYAPANYGHKTNISHHSWTPYPHERAWAENRMILGGAMACGWPPIFNDFSAYSFDLAKE
jgi:hypothetical protein